MLIFTDKDGTLFNNEHRADGIPQDKSTTQCWHEFNARHIYDTPIAYRIDLLKLLALTNTVVYVTSRTSTFFDSTQAQLNMAGCPTGRLLMRGSGDNRHAADFKISQIKTLIWNSDEFGFIDDDKAVCARVAHEFGNARIIKVPSQCCAYLASSRGLRDER